MYGSTRCRLSRSRARGQALVFGLLFTACAAAVLLLLFNSSQLANTKSQLQNAADAGAYSAALLQARDSNFSAYTNRAMIANQVAVAQFVSLESYFEDAAQTHRRANSRAHAFYRSSANSAPRWDSGKRVPIDTAYSAVRNLAGPAVQALDLLISAMDEAQEIHHVATMIDMMRVADEVVKKNDERAGITRSAFMLGDAAVRVANWGNQATQRFRANDLSPEADRFADAVVDRDSLDLFVRNRGSVPTPSWSSRASWCPLAARSRSTFAFTHAGGTILSANKRRWLGLDATMGGGFVSCTWLLPCLTGVCPFTLRLPLPDVSTTLPLLGGSGRAQAGTGRGYDDARGYRNNAMESWLYGYALTSTASVPALYRYWAGPGATLDASGGLQPYYRDVSDPLATTSRPRNQSAAENGGAYPVTIEVERTAGTLRLSSDLLPGSDQLRLDAGLKGNSVRALASAHAYFYRPRSDDLSQFTRNGWRRSDRRTEYQNLFSPYWQARLAPTPAAEEMAAAAGQ